MTRRTFAQIEQQLEDMPVCSTKYRLLAALYDGLLTDGMAPDSPEKMVGDLKHVLPPSAA